MGLYFDAAAENPKENHAEVKPVQLKTQHQLGTSWSRSKKGTSRPFLFELSTRLHEYVS